MTTFDLKCMKYSIDIANSIKTKSLKVGFVASIGNEIVLTSVSTSRNPSGWIKTVLTKVKRLNIQYIQCIYLTINTLSIGNRFDLNKLLAVVTIEKIFIGMPDPNLGNYITGDPVILLDNVFRYPDNLQKFIVQQNSKVFAKSKQNIQLSPYYSEIRISNLVQKYLADEGIIVSKQALGKNKDVEKLVQFLISNTKLNSSKANEIVYRVLSNAFNKKYAEYDYHKDARFIKDNWIINFKNIITRFLVGDFYSKNILNVGVGNGEESIELFSKCKHVTFVDIARGGLEMIKKALPRVHTAQLRAENLDSIKNDKFDVYISLRTYNSSFFDIKLAISEAIRVLKNKGLFIVSVANGFLCVNNTLIPGLIVPNLEFVDIYRGLSLIKDITIEWESLGGTLIKIIPTDTEIYLIGTIEKKRSD